MNIQHPPSVARYESPRKDAHEPGEHDELMRARRKGAQQRIFEGGGIGKGRRFDDARRKPQIACTGNARRIRLIAEHVVDGRVDAPCCAGLRDRDHIGAAARDENGKDKRSVGAHSSITTPPLPCRTSPMIAAVSPCALNSATEAPALCAGTMATMPMPQLKVRYISCRSMRPARCSQSK